MTDIEAQVAQFGENFQHVRTEIAKVIVGHADVVEGLLVCLLCGGHALLEGVPGLGKTLLVKSLGAALHLDFYQAEVTFGDDEFLAQQGFLLPRRVQ